MIDRLGEVDQAAMRRKIENTQRAGYSKTFSDSRAHALAIIHQQQVGPQKSGQLNRRFLTFIDSV
jgi:hypothetical protein